MIGIAVKKLVAASAAALLAFACTSDVSEQRSAKNILLIVVDDMGFTDIGVYGSEIPTPNLDRLARNGSFFTDLHAGMTCSPTRAMLLSGVDHHRSGLGNMAEDLAPNQEGQPGYEGYLNFSVAALPEILQAEGYRTFMAGKWHLGMTPETNPAARGFDHSFALLQGGAGHFANMMPMVGPGKAKYTRNGEAIEALPEDFYSTTAFTEELLQFLGEDDGAEPFFAYLAYSAPHWPIQAPQSQIEQFRGAYDDGYDALFERRLAAGKRLGVIPLDARGAPRASDGVSWASLSADERAYEARRMEIYAAMIAGLDREIGRVLESLESAGRLEETMIIFLSDNGYEGHDMRSGFVEAAQWAEQCCDNSLENIGAADSYVWMGPDWSRAATPAFRLYKGFPTEGGTRVPAIVRFPGQAETGINHNLVHVTDLFATMLDWADITYDPKTFGKGDLHRPEGVSLMPILNGDAEQVHDPDAPFVQELFGKRAVRWRNWKAVLIPAPHGSGDWQLYDLSKDLAETRDLDSTEPETLARLVKMWDDWAQENDVILPDWVSGY